MHPRTVALAGTLCLAIGWALGSQSSTPASSAGPAAARGGPQPLGVSGTPPAPLTQDLRLRLERLPEPPVLGRNPFRFGATRPATSDRYVEAASGRANSAPPGEPVAGTAPAEAVLAVTLSGIATDDTPDGPRHTAILSAGGQLVFAGVNEPVPGGFRVASIDGVSVTLRDETGGERTLRLR